MTQTADQSSVIAFLEDPETHDGASVERIDTHMSHIFLTPDRAYKLMRAVRYEMVVDFSTLAARKAACEAELDANAAMAAPLYRSVRAVTRDDNGVLHWGGPGESLDYVVEMARFDEATRFDRLADRGGLERWMIDQVADLAAAAHLGAPQRQNAFGRAGLESLVEELTRNFRGEGARAVDAGAVNGYLDALSKAAGDLAPLAEARREAGLVRRCHGDLHLANMCLYKGRAVPFDAIVFNDAFTDIDVLYDLAFAAMDLVRVDRADLAGSLTSRYLSATRDYEGLALWPLYLSLRAAIRAMVAALGPDGPEKTATAGRFLDLAQRLIAPRPDAHLIAVGGRSGTGKSTLARAIAPDLGGPTGAVTIKTDEIRKRLYGVTPEEPLPDAAYAGPVSAQVYARLVADTETALRSGATVIADATFLRADGRQALADAAERAGAAFTGLMLDADDATLTARLGARTHDVSDADAAVLTKQRVEEPLTWHRLDASADIATLRRQALAAVREA